MGKTVDKAKVFAVLEGENTAEKLDILQKLDQCEDYSIIEPLVILLEKEKAIPVKERMMVVLNRLIPLSQFEYAEPMLRSPDPFVRNGIVEIIKRNNKPIIEFLEKLAEDEDKDVRKFVIDSLSQESSIKVREILKRRLVDEDINIVYTAIEYLGNLQDRESADQIESFLFDSDNLMVRCASLLSLSKIKHSPNRDKVIENYSNIENPMIVFPFLKYLEVFGTESAFPYIEMLLDANNQIYGKEIIDAVQGIIESNELSQIPESLKMKLESVAHTMSNNVNRYELTKLLSRLEGKDSLPEVREMLRERNEISKLGAIEILGEIGDESDIERLEAIAEETDSDELLEAIGDAVEKISERLEKGDE